MTAAPAALSNQAKLKQRQSLPLAAKIQMTKARIRQWVEHWDGDVYVAFSGGRDSTVLLDLVWSIYSDVPAVFSNTGLELRDIKDFVRYVEKKGLTSIVNGQRVYRQGEVVRVIPEKSYKRVIEEDGFALPSKKVARTLRILKEEHGDNWANTYRLYDTGIKMDGTFSKVSMLPDKWRFLVNADIKVSEKCCDYLKKDPLKAYAKSSGRHPITGIMAEEGGVRASSTHQCNSYDLAEPKSAPLLFWTAQDISEYIRINKLRISQAYLWVKNEKNQDVEPEERTGCAFCMFGAHLDKGNNRFQRLYKRDHRMWDTAVNKRGLKKALDLIDVKYLPDDAPEAQQPRENNAKNAYVTNSKQSGGTEKAIKAAIKQIRKSGGEVTRQKVADLIGMSKRTVQRYPWCFVDKKAAQG